MRGANIIIYIISKLNEKNKKMSPSLQSLNTRMWALWNTFVSVWFNTAISTRTCLSSFMCNNMKSSRGNYWTVSKMFRKFCKNITAGCFLLLVAVTNPFKNSQCGNCSVPSYDKPNWCILINLVDHKQEMKVFLLCMLI